MKTYTDWMLDSLTDEEWREAIDAEIDALPDAEEDDEPSELEDARADEAFWAHGC